MQRKNQGPSPLRAKIQSRNASLLGGHVLEMSLVENRTRELWEGFGPVRRNMGLAEDTELYSVEVYPDLDYFRSFDPKRRFQKWACIEVKHTQALPKGVRTLSLPAGLYAVFSYRGAPEKVTDFYRQIFTGWFPGSGYELDNRPHFAVMGEKYRQGDPESEEEIWIPVTKQKGTPL